MTEHTEKKRIESYLLGEFSEHEREQLEEQFFADDEIFNDIEAAEMALIDRYIRNEMPAPEREKFEQNYLVTPERRGKVSDAKIFHKELKTLRVPTIVREGKASWFERLFAGLGLSFSATQLAGAAALVILTLAVGWLLYDSMRLRQEVLVARNQQAETERSLNQQLEQKEKELQEKIAAQNSSSETVNTLEDEVERLRNELDESRKNPRGGNAAENPPQQTPLVATVFLIGSRGGNVPTQINLASGTKVLNLRIPINPSDGSEFDVKITGDSGVVFERDKLVPRAVQDGRILSVNISADKLHEGFYQVLTRNEKGEERTRSFVVRPK